ncbi:MAG: superinfection immunity protein [Terracidiphilus sp.]
MDTTSLIRIVSGILVLVLSLFYFYPTFKAMGKRNTGAIFAINLLTGWCAIGWFVALVWALKNDVVALRPDEVQQYAGRDRRIKVFIYIFWSIVVIFLAVVMILAYAFPASQPTTQSPAEFFAPKPSAIDTVRNGYLSYNKTITIGQALGNTFQKGVWKTFVTEKGATWVEFDGSQRFGDIIGKPGEGINQAIQRIQECEKRPMCKLEFETVTQSCPPDQGESGLSPCLVDAFAKAADDPILVTIQFSINHDGTFQYEANDLNMEADDLFEKMYN